MSAPYLEVTGLKKSYGLKPALRGIDLCVEQGQRMALLGANGAGKTTLLRILAGLTKPGAGMACIGGLDIQRDAQAVRSLVGFVAHQPYLYEELTALENLRLFRTNVRCEAEQGARRHAAGAGRAGETRQRASQRAFTRAIAAIVPGARPAARAAPAPARRAGYQASTSKVWRCWKHCCTNIAKTAARCS